MLFNTITYAYFFVTVFAVSWALAPWRKVRLGFLLVSSYVFYAGWTFVGWDVLFPDPTRPVFAQLQQRVGEPEFWVAVFQSIQYVPLLFVATSIDYYLGVWLDRIEDPGRRKLMLVGTILLNVGILVFFKYWNWGAESFLFAIRQLFGVEVPDLTLRVQLPIGISFFCFMSLSYVIDVYRREIPACRSYLSYLTYISFFPHLVAGPIIRGRDLLPHLERKTRLTPSTAGEGLFLIAGGLFKKVVIGDYIAVNFVDRVFAEPTSYSSVEAMFAMYGYAVQVYCDFAGYSDVAIGSALLLGYRFKINFDAPFKSTNIVEFWRRWHISLSTWLRDYVYIPLGGSRKGAFRKYLNIFLTMLICGVWHGAAWTYFVFGCVQGVALSITHWFVEFRSDPARARTNARGLAMLVGLNVIGLGPILYAYGHPGLKVLAGVLLGGGALVALLIAVLYRGLGSAARGPARVVAVAANFTFVGLTFTMFRAASLDKAGAMYERLLTLTTYTPNLHRNVLLIILGALVLQWTPRRFYDRAREVFIAAPAPMQAAAMFAVFIALREAATADAVPFVYFQF
ncbi:MAG: MBOAT family O-acyltransferase [Myxococcota bacterium]